MYGILIICFSPSVQLYYGVTNTANDFKNSEMNFEQKPPRDFSKQNQIGILGVHATQFALDIFVSVFLVSRLLEISNGNFSSVALFYLVCWGSLFVMFWLFSYVIKKFSRVWCIRASTAGLLLSIILILLLKDNLGTYYLLLGAIYGISAGIYWCSMHTFTTEALGGKKMAGYTAWFIGIAAFTRILFPFTLGAIIQFVNFATAASIATGLAVILLVFTLVLRDQKKTDGQGFSMRRFFRHVKERKLSRPFWAQFWIQTLYGIIGVATICVTVIVAMEFDNFRLGYLTSIFAGVSIIVLAVYKAIKAPRGKIWLYYMFSALPLLMALGLLFGLNPVTVILCQAGYLSFKTSTQSELERARMNLMSDFDAEHLHTEGLFFIEAAYTMARYVGLGCVIAIYFSGQIYLLQVFLVILMSALLIAAIVLRIWTKKFLHVQKNEVLESLPANN